MAGISRDLGRDVPDLEKLYARKLWADFPYPILAFHNLLLGDHSEEGDIDEPHQCGLHDNRLPHVGVQILGRNVHSNKTSCNNGIATASALHLTGIGHHCQHLEGRHLDLKSQEEEV